LPPAITPLRTVAARDPDGSALTVWSIGEAVWLTIGGLCSLQSGLLLYRLLFFDSSGNLTGCSPTQQLQAASGAADFGTQWIGTPISDAAITVCSAGMALKVDSITGTWTLNASAFNPPP
jgi:hypothetical protein